MAKLILYETPSTGELEVKAGTTIFDGRKTYVKKLTIFINSIGYITLDRVEALKLKTNLINILKTRNNVKNT